MSQRIVRAAMGSVLIALGCLALVAVHETVTGGSRWDFSILCIRPFLRSTGTFLNCIPFCCVLKGMLVECREERHLRVFAILSPAALVNLLFFISCSPPVMDLAQPHNPSAAHQALARAATDTQFSAIIIQITAIHLMPDLCAILPRAHELCDICSYAPSPFAPLP